MKHTQMISVYRNRRTGEYRVQPFGRLRNGSSQAFGKQVRVPTEVSDRQLLTTILDNLATNDLQVYSDELAPKIPKEEWRRQLREEQLITVHRSELGFQLVPSRRMGNSFGSIDEMISMVPSKEFLSAGGEIIRKLFDEIP
jgi:hypothetical protein